MTTDLRKTGNFLVHNLEAFIWIAVLLCFAISPWHSGEHFIICPLRLAGFEHCPGCGLGRSMILLLHGEVAGSIRMHLLSIPALVLLVTRIVVVFMNYNKYIKMINIKSIYPKPLQK